MYLIWEKSRDNLKNRILNQKLCWPITVWINFSMYFVISNILQILESFSWSLEQFFLFRKSEQFWKQNKIPTVVKLIPLIICHFHLIRIKSLIDASPMDGIMSIRMSAGGTDYMNGDNLIRWTEVFLLPCVLVTCFHESWIFYIFREKVSYDIKKPGHSGIDENPFRTDQNKRHILWKNSVFVDSGFVKTWCDEIVIGQKILTGLLMLRIQRVLPVI